MTICPSCNGSKARQGNNTIKNKKGDAVHNVNSGVIDCTTCNGKGYITSGGA